MRLGVTALAPGMCFDAECQAAMDRAFLIATLLPLLGLAGAIGFRLRPAHMQKRDGKQACIDHATLRPIFLHANPTMMHSSAPCKCGSDSSIPDRGGACRLCLVYA